jgi:tetratricopeptide (TPR) repeat protein
MYTQAMKASHQVALDYANTMIDVIQNAYESRCDKSQEPVFFKEEEFIKQERAVILRLMGKYDEALREFDDLLTLEESYECLIQTSYLKHLMEDKGGALEYALRAKDMNLRVVIFSYIRLVMEHSNWVSKHFLMSTANGF